MRVDAGRVARAYELVDGRPVPVDGAGMAFTVDGRRWSATDMVASEVQAAADHSRLSWLLAGDGLSVRVVVEADRRAGVVRTGAEVAGRGRLGHVELDRWADLAVDGFESTGEPVAYNVGPVGLGQPVFGPGFFAGVEHPVAENLVGPGGRGAALGIPLAVDLGPEPTPLPAAIMGAGGLEEFWDYVDTLRPVPPRLVTLANNWYHLGATGLMDEAAVRAEVQGFAGVADRHGLVLDFLCLDDGWEGEWEPATGLWGRMAPARFPHGIGPLGPGIGLWLSAFGGYADRRKERLAFAPAGGFEVDPSAGLLCAAGSRYRAHLLDALTRWTREGVAYWKLDGLRFDCEEPTHGHPVGPGARTAQVDAFRGLVDGIRVVRPDAVVAFTIGSHPSPWWLSTVDFLWRGGLDDTAADRPGSRLDRFDTYVDTCLHAYRRAALPVSALVTFSIVESAAAGYRDDRSGPNGWARHCWLAAGRGTLHQDLYVAPDSLSEPEWAVLAEALAWARRHEHVLARSRMVLGDPAAGEVYGFLARKGDEATLCLRNPGDRPQSLDPDWAAHTGFPDAPRTLAPFEVVVLTRRR